MNFREKLALRIPIILRDILLNFRKTWSNGITKGCIFINRFRHLASLAYVKKSVRARILSKTRCMWKNVFFPELCDKSQESKIWRLIAHDIYEFLSGFDFRHLASFSRNAFFLKNSHFLLTSHFHLLHKSHMRHISDFKICGVKRATNTCTCERVIRAIIAFFEIFVYDIWKNKAQYTHKIEFPALSWCNGKSMVFVQRWNTRY